jgi:hypothetical protein
MQPGAKIAEMIREGYPKIGTTETNLPIWLPTAKGIRALLGKVKAQYHRFWLFI